MIKPICNISIEVPRQCERALEGREQQAPALAPVVERNADEVDPCGIHQPRVMADAQVANGRERDRGDRPGTSEDELMVVEIDLALAVIEEDLTVKSTELFRRGDIALARADVPRRHHVGTASSPGRGCSCVYERFHVRAHFPDRLVTELRALFECPQDDRIESHVDLHLARRRLEMAFGQLTGEQLVEHHAERVDVCPMIHVRRAIGLLGRHVLGRAEHALLSQARRKGRPRCGNPIAAGPAIRAFRSRRSSRARIYRAAGFPA